ncbi:helix-turn-helix domain-containing protein [Dyella sp.]|uniref:helix-turn-helix domain-containing protein n=1 Tax=Dyella sp. TaxID=1869338 RepID=UPI003F7D23C1
MTSNDTEKQLLVSFGERVRAIRKMNGLSQEELGNAARLDRTYIGSVERGERNVSLVNIHRIAKALGVEMAELVKAHG